MEVKALLRQKFYKNSFQKRVSVCLEDLGDSVGCERLLRALSLFLFEEDVVEYLLASQNFKEHSFLRDIEKNLKF